MFWLQVRSCEDSLRQKGRRDVSPRSSATIAILGASSYLIELCLSSTISIWLSTSANKA
ncbi:hypothetical protein MtrunA17_Chr5g0431091 [Medicago truncatula]|uniref:Uncharacterized protein n=1 Tax=Medicago truncatula TaxID=3880 RepID=A0A396HVQ0_MEDTR|nr:hypothetical protein MtrunA17_Chr5g0431091 [Medicago truncatula]